MLPALATSITMRQWPPWLTITPDIEAMTGLATDTERFETTDRAFFLYAPDGIGRSKLAERAERLLGVPATARNLNTCQKLVAMLDPSANG